MLTKNDLIHLFIHLQEKVLLAGGHWVQVSFDAETQSFQGIENYQEIYPQSYVDFSETYFCEIYVHICNDKLFKFSTHDIDCSVCSYFEFRGYQVSILELNKSLKSRLANELDLNNEPALFWNRFFIFTALDGMAISIDTLLPDYQPVILTPYDGFSVGLVLGHTFLDFFERMLAIGFMPMSFHAYVTGDINRILDPNTDDFRRLRQYYGVDETLFAPLLDEINERHKIYEARMNEYFALRGDFSAWNG